jgi:hypothetical protein
MWSIHGPLLLDSNIACDAGLMDYICHTRYRISGMLKLIGCDDKHVSWPDISYQVSGNIKYRETLATFLLRCIRREIFKLRTRPFSTEFTEVSKVAYNLPHSTPLVCTSVLCHIKSNTCEDGLF